MRWLAVLAMGCSAVTMAPPEPRRHYIDLVLEEGVDIDAMAIAADIVCDWTPDHRCYLPRYGNVSEAWNAGKPIVLRATKPLAKLPNALAAAMYHCGYLVQYPPYDRLEVEGRITTWVHEFMHLSGVEHIPGHPLMGPMAVSIVLDEELMSRYLSPRPREVCIARHQQLEL